MKGLALSAGLLLLVPATAFSQRVAIPLSPLPSIPAFPNPATSPYQNPTYGSPSYGYPSPGASGGYDAGASTFNTPGINSTGVRQTTLPDGSIGFEYSLGNGFSIPLTTPAAASPPSQSGTDTYLYPGDSSAPVKLCGGVRDPQSGQVYVDAAACAKEAYSSATPQNSPAVSYQPN